MKILILDDDQAFCEMAQKYLGEIGIDNFVTTSIEEAESKLSSDSFDIAIIDILMPIENGIEFVNRMRSKMPDTIFYIATVDYDNEKVTYLLNNNVVFANTMSKVKFIEGLKKILNGQYRIPA